MPSPFRTLFRCLVVAACLAPLAGCGALIVGGAAATAVVATDRRTAGEQVDDQTIELRVTSEISREMGDQVRVLGTSYAGRVLLVGDVSSSAERMRAESIVMAIPKVRKVFNYLRVGELTPQSVRNNDTWLTSKVKTQLISTKDVPFRTIKVTTERGVVYMLGKVTSTEGNNAALVASGIAGVSKVVKLFDVVSPESLQAQPSQSAAPIHDDSSSVPDANTGSDAQTMPVQ